MPRADYMVAGGLTVRRAQAIKGTVDAAVSAAGTNQATATLLTADYSLVTTGAAGTGVILPTLVASDDMVVANGVSAESLLVYPPAGGKLNNATANLPLTLPSRMAARFVCLNTIDFIVLS